MHKKIIKLILLSLTIFVALVINKPFIGVKSDDSQQLEKWREHYNTNSEFSFTYPSDWYIYDLNQGIRYKDYPGILITSYEFDPQLYDSDGSNNKDGEVTIAILFSGSDKPKDQTLEQYLTLRSLDLYKEKPKMVNIGKNEFVQLKGNYKVNEYYMSNGVNYYGILVSKNNNEVYNDFINQILGDIKLHKEEVIYLPTNDPTRTMYSEKYLKMLMSTEVVKLNTITTIPSMKLPWASGNHNFNSGPHDSNYGYNCNYCSIGGMNGVDYGMDDGTEVLAVADGEIYSRGNSGFGGYYVKVGHNEDSFISEYWHLKNFDEFFPPPVDEEVTQGRVIAKSGSLAHLHLAFSQSADGLVIDGYTIHVMQRVSEGDAWNYQGTMTKGIETTSVFTFCNGNTRKWSGSQTTVVADTSNAPVTSTNQPNYGLCIPSSSGDWVVSSDCTYTGSHTAPNNVVVRNNSVLTIDNGAVLNINFVSYKLDVENGSGVLVKDGGKIE